MQKIKPLNGLTEQETETILNSFIKKDFGVACKMLYNFQRTRKVENRVLNSKQAKETIEKWIEQTF